MSTTGRLHTIALAACFHADGVVSADIVAALEGESAAANQPAEETVSMTDSPLVRTTTREENMNQTVQQLVAELAALKQVLTTALYTTPGLGWAALLTPMALCSRPWRDGLQKKNLLSFNEWTVPSQLLLAHTPL